MPQPNTPISLHKSQPDLVHIQKLFEKGSYRKALFQSKKALKLLPERPDLHGVAAHSAFQVGNVDEAINHYKTAISIQGKGGVYSTQLADLYAKMGDFDAAITHFSDRLRTTPQDARACHGLGQVLSQTGKRMEALTILAEAVQIDPTNPKYFSSLGRAFRDAGMTDQALNSFEIARQLDPDDVVHYLNSIRSCYSIGQAARGFEILSEAEEKWPKDASLQAAKGVILAALGQKEAAKIAYLTAISLDPNNSGAFYNYLNVASQQEYLKVEAGLRALLKQNPESSDLGYLQFALAKIEQQHGHYADAYQALKTGNRLRKAHLNYDISQDASLFQDIKAQFDGEVTPNTTSSPDDPTPIFITGLPRSGTTLTEAILARHARVTPMGELGVLSQVVRRCYTNRTGLSAKQGADLRAEYLAAIPETDEKPDMFTDKMPLNFRLIGYIASAMPTAQIIHVQRDARANCWSIFNHYFSSTGMGFAYDPDDIVQYYQMYKDLMDFWMDRFGDRIVTLDYEALVADQEKTTRNLIKDLSLTWDDNCLTPERADHMVRTASAQQVRKQVYAGSSQTWRAFEPFAGDWLERVKSLD